MGILWLILILAVIGVVLWLVNAHVPMPPIYKSVLNVIVIIAVLIWLLGGFFYVGPPGPYYYR